MDWPKYYANSDGAGCNPAEVVKAAKEHIAGLEADIKALEWMLAKAGYSDEQIKAKTPYVEVMGS